MNNEAENVKQERIDVKQAVKLAKRYFYDLFEDERLNDFHLEEVELSKNEKIWLVTFGYNTGRVKETETRPDPMRSSGMLFGEKLVERDPIRDYKTIEVDATTGELIALKMYGG